MENKRLEYSIWILEKLRVAKNPLTLRELETMWGNEDRGAFIHRDTFRNYRDYILDMFDINIKRDGKYYSIDEKHKGRTSFAQWFYDVVMVNEAVDLLGKMKNRFFIEGTSSGTEYIHPLALCIIDKKVVELTYTKFNGEVSTRLIEPWFIKLVHRRWYVIGKDLCDENLKTKTFGLDRINGVRATSNIFSPPTDDKIFEYFQYSIGAYSSGCYEIEDVEFEATDYLPSYLESLKIHETMKVIERSDNRVRFSMHVAITPDLSTLFASYAGNCEIIRPSSLRKDLYKRFIRGAIDNYGTYKDEDILNLEDELINLILSHRNSI